MEKLQSQAVSTFREHYRTTLRQLSQGPVLLLQNSKIAAVLVSPDQWNAQQQELTKFRLDNAARRAFEQVKNGEAKTMPHDELKRQILARRTQHVGN